MTTKDLIKALPFEESMKMEILRTFDFLEPDQRLVIERLVWNTYHELYEQMLDQNLQLQFQGVVKGKGEFGDKFYAEALKKTEKDMEKELSEDSSEYDLSAAREAMKLIVNEINDAKNKPKPKTSASN